MQDRTLPIKQAVRSRCLFCMNNQPKEVRLCPTKECLLYPFRSGKQSKGGCSPKLIRIFCLDCSGGSVKEVRSCVADCALYPYRLGKNPNRRGIGRGSFQI